VRPRRHRALLRGPSTSPLRGALKSALKILVAALAVIGAAYCVLFLWVYFFAPKCVFSQTEQAVAPNGQHFAVFQQSLCEDPLRSRSEVLVGKPGIKERLVVLEVRGTSHVALTWNSDSELVVALPGSATTRVYPAQANWPRVTLRKQD
jgi:hypothetical protein